MRRRTVACLLLGVGAVVALSFYVYWDGLYASWKLSQLDSESSARRKESVKWLGKNPSRDVLSRLLRTLREETVEDVRVEAVLSLVLQGEEAVRELVRRLEDKEIRLGTQAVYSIGRYEEKGAFASPLLEHYARKGPPEYRRAAIHTAVRMRAAGIPILIASFDSLESCHSLLQLEAIKGLISNGAPAVIPVLRAVDRKLIVCKMLLKRFFKELGEDALPELVKALAVTELRISAFSYIAQMREIGKPAGEGIVSLLESDDSTTRALAAKTIGLIKYNSQEALMGLSRLALVDDDISVREASIRAIGRLKPRRPEPIIALGKALEDYDEHVRFTAAKALGRIGSPAASAMPSIRKALTRTGEYAIRTELARSLSRMGAAAEPAVPELIVLYRLDPSISPHCDDLRERAIEALGAIASKEAAKILVEASRDKDAGVSRRARHALSLIDR